MDLKAMTLHANNIQQWPIKKPIALLSLCRRGAAWYVQT